MHRCRCRTRVVAKSALFRFRLAAKTAHAPLLLLSPRKPLRWVSVGSHVWAVALSERDGELHSPNPLCAPRSQTPALRLSGSTEPEYPSPKGGDPIDFCHIPVSIIKRSEGRSAVAAAAYRSGTALAALDDTDGDMAKIYGDRLLSVRDIQAAGDGTAACGCSVTCGAQGVWGV